MQQSLIPVKLSLKKENLSREPSLSKYLTYFKFLLKTISLHDRPLLAIPICDHLLFEKADSNSDITLLFIDLNAGSDAPSLSLESSALESLSIFNSPFLYSSVLRKVKSLDYLELRSAKPSGEVPDSQNMEDLDLKTLIRRFLELPSSFIATLNDFSSDITFFIV